MKRKSISKKTRFDVFKRDGFVCQYCGSHPPTVILEVDHIIAVAEGGDNNKDNLITSCFDCNRGKGANSLSSVPKSLAEKAKEMKEREEQIEGYRKIMEQVLDRIDRDMWRVAEILIPNSSETGFRIDWLNSIKRFNERLDIYEVMSAAEIAKSKSFYSEKKMFVYFCGICWNRIKVIENGAV